MTDFENIQGSLLPYDHQEIEIVLKQVLLNNGITDVLYEGSNISQLSSIISFLISSLNLNTAINMQETILPLASKRMNILFGARQLGYESHAKKSYIYTLTLKPLYDNTKLTPSGEIDKYNTEERKISIVKNTKFVSGDKTYWYVGPTLIDVISVSNYDIQFLNDPTRGKTEEELLIQIPVVEGEFISYLDDQELQFTSYEYLDENGNIKTKQDYLIPYKNVEDEFGLQVYLTYINEDGYEIKNEEWVKSEAFLIDETLDYNKKKFIRKENIILGYPAIFFEFAGFGNSIGPGTQIKVNVLQSSGIDGIATEPIKIDDTVLSLELEVINQEIYQRGINEESDDSIKENAIVFHNTANRAVTRLDYIAITKRHPLVKNVDAWGGEEEDPQIKGNIWISATPQAQFRPIIEHNTGYTIDIGTPSHTPTNEYQYNWRNWYLTEFEYSDLISYLDNYKIITMQINYRHPLYINFDFNVDIVKYDISRSPKTINAIVFDTINNYFINQIESFESEYLNSNLQRILDSTLGYNAGVNLELKLSGTLCEDMIDKYYSQMGSDLIIVSLSYPYENIVDNLQILLDKIPLIDTQQFGFYDGNLTVNYSELNSSLIEDVRRAKIYYTDANNNSIIFGEYIIDLKKKNITIVFDFNWSMNNRSAIEEIFGPIDSNTLARTYQFFDINYYPYDLNVVNIPFSKHKIARLRNVNFISN